MLKHPIHKHPGNAHLRDEKLHAALQLGVWSSLGVTFIAMLAALRWPAEAATLLPCAGYGIGVAILFLFSYRRMRHLEESWRKRQEDFLGVLSHDIRNPLTSALLNLDVLERLTALPSGTTHPQRKAMELVRRGLNQVGNLVRDLVTVAQIESRTLTVELESLSIGAFIDELRESLSEHLKNRAPRVQWAVHPPEGRQLRVDREKVFQAFLSLIIALMQRSADSGELLLSFQEAGEFLACRFETAAGAPISLEERERDSLEAGIWLASQANRDPFALSLAIARGIVLVHGGQITLGPTLKLELPLQIP